MLPWGMLVLTVSDDADGPLITEQSPSYDGVLLITGKMSKLRPATFGHLRALP